MNIFIVEYDHKHGTEIWATTTEQLANEIVRTVKTHLFHESGDDEWTLEKALENWTEFSGGNEYFRINEIPLIDNINQSRAARV